MAGVCFCGLWRPDALWLRPLVRFGHGGYTSISHALGSGWMGVGVGPVETLAFSGGYNDVGAIVLEPVPFLEALSSPLPPPPRPSSSPLALGESPGSPCGCRRRVGAAPLPGGVVRGYAE